MPARLRGPVAAKGGVRPGHSGYAWRLMLQGLTLIFFCQLLGEALVRLLGVPFPGPVAGMVILLVALVVAGGPPEPLRRAGTGLLTYLPLFFVPAGVGLIAHGARLKTDGIPILLAIVGSTLLTMLLVGWLIARFAPREDMRND
jgi:holin-like protein